MVPANGLSTVVEQKFKSCIWAGSGIASLFMPMLFALQIVTYVVYFLLLTRRLVLELHITLPFHF